MASSSLHIKSQKGQMALFVAMIFQVLFVFFAMIINVGLIVHDKINLQNSVDIAAYYAAERQAEMLNAVGHYNYQIRQAWKLLTFRYRVLGDLGFKDHPIQKPGEMFSDIAVYPDVPVPGSRSAPSVCINHAFWGANQNICYKPIDIKPIPPIPPPKIINPFLPSNFVAAGLINQFIGDADKDCNATGPMNFVMLTKWMLAYRMQIGQAKTALKKYADILSQDSSNFVDIRGDSVALGAVKTIRDNLTRANLETFDADNFKLYNSLGLGDRKKWLNEVLLLPRIYYTNTTGNNSGCKGEYVFIDGAGFANDGVPKGVTATPTINFARKESNVDDNLYHSSFGFEKNPWVMAYVGVYAETAPRKPFLPFGKPIKLTARAFAKPFGGRIGPWFFKRWPQGSNKSSAAFANQVDQLVPVSFNPDDQAVSDGANVLPNYSRFPGDTLGLRSQAALGVFKKGLKKYFTDSTSGVPRAVKPLSAFFYDATPVGGDGLAQLPPAGANFSDALMLGYSGPWIRDFEVAAVAPDLFDATYYSVDPDSYNAYTKKGIERIMQNQNVPYDIGSSIPQVPVGIAKQIEIANQLKSTNTGMNFYLINETEHLLTAWAPSGAFEYKFPSNAFAKCARPGNIAIPGSCAAGGRVGYSVKLVSKDYLTSGDLQLGGQGASGPILNPPQF